MSNQITSPANVLTSALARGQAALSEHEAKEVLAAYEIPVAPEILTPGPDEAVTAASQLGYPVAVKACGPALLHKSDIGLVALNLHNAAAVAIAVDTMRETLADTPIDGFLVQRMVRGKREIIVGGLRDPLFGPCVMLGLGGILVEAIGDVTFRLAPLTERDALEMLTEIRGRGVFDAVRGEPAVDRDALAKILAAVGQMLMNHPEIAQIDINPVIFEGDQPVAVDALIALQNPEAVKSFISIPPDSTEAMKRKYHALFEPSSVAIVGASLSPLKWGFRILYNTINGGYKGELYGVNPKHTEILGAKCYPSVDALPERVDLALIVLPPEHVVDTVRACAAKGISAVVVITAGMGEVDDPAAHQRQETIAAIAREAGMLLVGPNCAGIASPDPESLYSGMIYRYPRGGGLSIVSQSGNVGMTGLSWAMLHQTGIARFVSSGNEAVTRCEDYLHFCARDARTKSILAYIEGSRDGRRLFAMMNDAAQKKPLVVVKGGRSQAGQKAASSHTGALASATALFEAACRQAGATVVDDIYLGFEVAASFMHQPLPRGRRVVIVSEGGGWGVLAADACAAQGLDVIPLPEDIYKELDKFMPGWWSRGNPIDLVAGYDRTMMSRAVETVIQHPDVDAVLVLGIGYVASRSARLRASEEVERLGLTKLIDMATNMEVHDARRLMALIEQYEKPIIAASDTVILAYGANPNEAIAELERLGGYAFVNPLNAARTLALMVERYEYLNGIPRAGSRRDSYRTRQ